MTTVSLVDRVEGVMRLAAEQAILPRYRVLQAGEVEEKSPGELVTAADREAEALLFNGLRGLVPGALLVGEELASERPEIMEGLSDGWLWLVDPLDGTANFVAGSPEFAVMVALLRNGRTVLSCMLDPIRCTLYSAELGAGAFIDGQRARCPVATLPITAGRLRGAVLRRFLPPGVRASVERGEREFAEILPGARCAGVEYPAIVTGRQHFALFWRTLPWDHAPGTLFLSEAGGHVSHADGTAYTPSDGRPGLIVAQSDEIGREVMSVLLGPKP